jgi:hypothetical protein
MHRLVLVLALLLATGCKGSVDVAAKRLREERDPVKLANIEWRMLGKFDHAAARLRNVASHEARVEAARIARERGDYALAREEARKALELAKTPRERQRAHLVMARIVDADPRASAEELRATIESMRALIAEFGPLLNPSRLLARSALRAGDGAAALEGINAYYRVSAFAGPPKTIAAAHADVTRILSSSPWTNDRAALARALAGIRFIDEVLLVTSDGDAAKYARTLKRLEKVTNEYYRQIANGNEDDDVLRDAVQRELPEQDELAKRYGAAINVGKTGGHVDLHLGHIVDARDMRVEQYGHSATLRFVALDSMVSNGYLEWESDGRSGDGGWGTDEEIVQVRPRYADGALHEWQLLSEAPKADADLAERLKRQYLDSVVTDLRAKGLSGSALREAFIARVTDEQFQSSIVLHEGRHAIDHKEKRKGKVWEMEYRAKLASVALAPSPREALSGIFDFEIGGDSTHGKANEKFANELVAWMKAHRNEIPGLDDKSPLLQQLDKLTDAQMRAAARSLDPLARR